MSNKWMAFALVGAISGTLLANNHVESADVIVELDPSQYNARARDHKMQVLLELDPVLRGRAALSFNYELIDWLALHVAARFDHSSMSQFYNFLELIQGDLPSYMAITGGVGAKMRLTEWTLKSSFYILPAVHFGLSQSTLSDGTVAQAFRIAPSIALGWEKVYNNGFSIGAALTVERPFDLGGIEYNDFDVSTGVQIGYAW